MWFVGSALVQAVHLKIEDLKKAMREAGDAADTATVRRHQEECVKLIQIRKELEQMLDVKNLSYADYLKTPLWQRTRALAKERALNRCQLCNSPEQLDVHHRTYVRLGREHDADLTVLCRECHGIFHQRLGLYNKKETSGLTKLVP